MDDMPKLPRKIGNERQLHDDTALRTLLTTVLRDYCNAHQKSREQVCDALKASLGQGITVFMLNDWTSESKKPARFPASFIEAFCEVTGDSRLQRYVMGPRLRRLVEFAERDLAAAKDERERQRMRARLLREENGAGEDS
jgi:hypothetical protein